ncbi:unnamed protein product [Spirodela intermedia]|uniref:Uncharacterized protein n=1 Tax=Spirodela intermedia TaxID=51605 RepID=A0A7I8JQR9_SPIIN|nr:unnamed protein product [Spirodela intermedia]CAA6672504.1 unnamed protein product [Spirodela intermedia]
MHRESFLSFLVHDFRLLSLSLSLSLFSLFSLSLSLSLSLFSV